MQPKTMILLTMLMLISTAGCEDQFTGGLPTATPAPVDAIPTSTATFLPPPTVTPFPTATPRGNGPVIAPPAVDAGASPAAPLATSPSAAPPLEPSLNPLPPTATPVPTSALVNLPGGVNLGERVFYADFFQGWPTENFPTVKMVLKDGQYDFQIGPQDAGIRSTGIVQGGNVYQQIEFTPDNCPDGSGFGLRVRQKDSGSYDRFSVFCDNTYKSAVVINGSVNELASGSLPADTKAGTPTTHVIGIAAYNSTFTYYFDGEVVGTASDTQLAQGDVAFYAFSQGAGVLQVAFDNWQVWTLR